MKKIVTFLFFFFLSILPCYALDFDTYSSHVLLYHLDDEKVLYEKGSEDEIPIASLTKIMTAIVVLDSISNLEDKVVIKKEDFKGLYEANAALAGFEVGEEVTYRDLLAGLLLPSGAEAASTLARVVGGGEEAFVQKMNDKAIELGLQHTHFVNTTGLDVDGHYSSLQDVFVMFSYALKKEEFQNLISMRYYTTSNGEHKFKSTIQKNMDQFDIEEMDYLIGGKTGSTGNAGLCFASLGKVNDQSFILITAGAPYTKLQPSSLLDAKKIYEYVRDHFAFYEVVSKKQELAKIKTQYLKEDYYVSYSEKDYSFFLEDTFLKEQVEYPYQGVELITHDMQVGDKLGELTVSYQGEILTTIPIVLTQKISFDIWNYLGAHKGIVFLIFSSIIVIILFLIFWMRKRKR